MGSEELHESRSKLDADVLDRHRAISSLCEELEAVDWYEQRIAATQDEQLRAILRHNRDEETEHAAMLIEWLRRRDVGFERHLRRFLFREDGPVENGEAESARDGSLGIGSPRPSS